MGGTGRPLGKTFFLQCQRRHPELPKIPTYLPDHFLFTEGPLYGLSFNATKSELHALNNAPHVTILISSSTHFSTSDNSGNPRIFYKYLGTYFFNQRQNTQMYQLLMNTINSFFTNLSTLPLSHNEIIKLSNIQLIPILTYRLIYNSLPRDKLDKLDSLIWTHISKSGKLSYCTPNKTKYSSNASFGLNVTKKFLSQPTYKLSLSECLFFFD